MGPRPRPILSRMPPHLAEAVRRPLLKRYLRILALFYAFGASVHFGNLIGFGEIPFAESPLSWQIGDIVYAALDTAVVIGLWRGRLWGIVCFCVAALSQIVLYSGFPNLFAFTEEQHAALRSMSILHLLCLGFFVGLVWVVRRRTDA